MSSNNRPRLLYVFGPRFDKPETGDQPCWDCATVASVSRQAFWSYIDEALLALHRGSIHRGPLTVVTDSRPGAALWANEWADMNRVEWQHRRLDELDRANDLWAAIGLWDGWDLVVKDTIVNLLERGIPHIVFTPTTARGAYHE